MKNPADTEDSVSETFYRLIKKSPVFNDTEHEKAWLIRTAGNVCKDFLKKRHRRDEDISTYSNILRHTDSDNRDVLEAVLSLPEKYKLTVWLYYYEGYKSAEVAKILKKPESTIRNYLSEARKLLKTILGDDYYEK